MSYYKPTDGAGRTVSTKQHSALGIHDSLTMDSVPTKNDVGIERLELRLLTGHLIRRWEWRDGQWTEEPFDYSVYKAVGK